MTKGMTLELGIIKVQKTTEVMGVQQMLCFSIWTWELLWIMKMSIIKQAFQS